MVTIGFAVSEWIEDRTEGGLAATLVVVWLRHAKPWAKVVALVLAALAVASVFFASYTGSDHPCGNAPAPRSTAAKGCIRLL